MANVQGLVNAQAPDMDLSLWIIARACRKEGGRIEMSSRVHGFPAVAYTGSVDSYDLERFIPDVLLATVTLWYFLITWLDIGLQLSTMRAKSKRAAEGLGARGDESMERQELANLVLMTKKNRWGACEILKRQTKLGCGVLGLPVLYLGNEVGII